MRAQGEGDVVVGRMVQPGMGGRHDLQDVGSGFLSLFLHEAFALAGVALQEQSRAGSRRDGAGGRQVGGDSENGLFDEGSAFGSQHGQGWRRA